MGLGSAETELFAVGGGPNRPPILPTRYKEPLARSVTQYPIRVASSPRRIGVFRQQEVFRDGVGNALDGADEVARDALELADVALEDVPILRPVGDVAE